MRRTSTAESRRKRLCHHFRPVRTFHNPAGALPPYWAPCTLLWAGKLPSKPIVPLPAWHASVPCPFPCAPRHLSCHLPNPCPPFQAQAGPSVSIPGAPLTVCRCQEKPATVHKSPGIGVQRGPLRSRSCSPLRIKSQVWVTFLAEAAAAGKPSRFPSAGVTNAERA